jgi:predicted SAM-dependent methyltransferase
VLKSLRRNAKRRWSFLRRRFLKPPLPQNAEGKVLLHIGCGPIKSPGFVNVDAVPYAHVHIVTDDIGRLSDFGTGTVDLVYMCHILEHFKRPTLKEVLAEMYRILKTGGVLRLSVPDFDRLLEVYAKADGNPDAICMQLMGGQDSEYNVHYSIFTHRSLSALLQAAGFSSIRPWDPQNCPHHDFKDKACKVMKVNGAQIAISLNLEAVK